MEVVLDVQDAPQHAQQDVKTLVKDAKQLVVLDAQVAVRIAAVQHAAVHAMLLVSANATEPLKLLKC